MEGCFQPTSGGENRSREDEGEDREAINVSIKVRIFFFYIRGELDRTKNGEGRRTVGRL